MYIVSKCLLGVNCKYSGGNNFNKKVVEFLENKKYCEVCPEVAGGMTIPRLPAEIIGEKVISSGGSDVTGYFVEGAKISLLEAKEKAKEFQEPIQGAILKSCSPSCGQGKIYDGSFSGKLVKGNGVFAQSLLDLGISVYTEDGDYDEKL